jgi:M6 family metalloprotease-like protein
MRRLAFLLLALVASVFAAKAVPATPHPVKYRQPDGSVITVYLHGDEFYHYATSEGKVVALGKDGFFRRAEKPVMSENAARRRRARNAVRPLRSSGTRDAVSLSEGDKHFLVLLIEFDDLYFTVPDANAAFSRMLNEPGYSDNGATGSVADYYKDNSNNRFRPVFDVYGPVRVSQGYAEYGKNVGADNNDQNAGGLLLEACQLLNDQVNFADYDLDDDGCIDNIFYYFAGHNEAEAAGADHIWPHAAVAYQPGLLFDGVSTWSYACTSEYRGRNGSNMAGIGTFCHEFAHVLGLPDLYDTDYEKNGSVNSVYAFSLMADGAYNNNGCSPPYMGALERWLLGWMENLKMTTVPGNYVLRPVQEDDCLSTPTSVDGEFFLYEVRNGENWDSFILSSSAAAPSRGMAIYHVDLSENAAGSTTAYNLWQNNKLNCYEGHPCYYMLLPNSSYSSYADMLWPGTSGKGAFEGSEWAGGRTGYVISGISWQGQQMGLYLEIPVDRRLIGKVSDSSGKPLAGVKVSAASQTVFTGDDGTYSFVFPLDIDEYLDVDFSKEMYYTRHRKARIAMAETILDMIMLSVSESEPVTLSKHGPPSGHAVGYQLDGPTWSGTIGVRYTADELASYSGSKLDRISFNIHGNTAAKIDVFVDFGDTRVFTKTLEPFKADVVNTVDISSAGLEISGDKDMIFGISAKEMTEQYWMSIDGQPYVTGGGVTWPLYTEKGRTMWIEGENNFLIDCEIHAGGPMFDAMALRTISNPGNGNAYSLGSVLPLSLAGSSGETPASVEWLFDGAPVSGTSVTLSTSGLHRLKAVLKYEDGSTEEIEQAVMVQ